MQHDLIRTRDARRYDRRSRARVHVGGALLAATALIAGCSSSSSQAPSAVVPDFSAAAFSNPSAVNHPLWSFPADLARTFATEGADEAEVNVVERLPGTRTVLGIECIRVRDREYAGGLLIEDTEDWYAQDDAGNVWYMGEASTSYEYDEDDILVGTDTEGSWEAGLDPLGLGAVARPGFAMPAMPAVGDHYYQEHYPGVAEDIGRVVALNVAVQLADGSRYTCVQTRETSSLEPSAGEFKYYASGVGVVLVEASGGDGRVEYRGGFVTNPGSKPVFLPGDFTAPDQIDHPLFPQVEGVAHVYFESSEDGSETIVVERLPGTRNVAGLDCARVRDRVYAGGLLIEDTEDWFAQDDAGNVWYMGEEVVNYEYDDEGVLKGTNDGGSWEAGLDVAGTGSIAEPGYQLPAVPVMGVAYYQEFYPGEAEDMGLPVADGVTVELPDGRVFEGCLRVLDWNPLEPDGLEYKLYAPGVGLVREEALHELQSASLVGSFDRGAASIPDLAVASFTTPTTIDHPLLPLPVGATFEYEAETEDGTETILVEVLPMVRVVAGVTCVQVRDQVFLDGVILEDTVDWFAQDDAGNVWYFGEEVVNYEYDEDGLLIGANDEGSWEAGLDVAGTGRTALPGIVMWANPAPGSAYYQEYYATEAEDMAQVIATGVTLVTPGGATWSGCLQTLDWNPLEPDGLEYKYYAPGFGLVFEEKLNDGEALELTDGSL